MTNDSRILVTGASGHLGANLVRSLLDRGEQVRVLLQESANNRGVAGLDVERILGDLRDPLEVEAAVKGCDRIFHCAAHISTVDGNTKFQKLLFDTNVLGTRNVVQAALRNGVRRVVNTSSFSSTGPNPTGTCDESLPFYPFDRPLPYSVTKTLAEYECLKAAVDGLDVVTAISCAIIGPNDFIPSRLGRTMIALSNRKLRAYINGGFEFVAARDIVAGHLLAMEKGVSGHRYIFGSQYLPFDELMKLMEEVTGQPRPKLVLPGQVAFALAWLSDATIGKAKNCAERRFTLGAVRRLRSHKAADCSKAMRELGYQQTSIKDAVREAYEFYCEEGFIR